MKRKQITRLVGAATRLRLRRATPPTTSAPAPPRVWSLLLPPAYFQERR